MHRQLQLGMRENPASERRHGSRLTVSGAPKTITSGTISQRQRPIERWSASIPLQLTRHPAWPQTAAARVSGGRSFTYACPYFEPLIGSPQAAKLLGNIHVNTLQRYARLRRIPGYQIGGHWYFRESELDCWLRSRLNSNCQPADCVDLTMERIP